MYGHAVVKVVRVSSMEVAEACKILENTYRAVNIALVNELKVLRQTGHRRLGSHRRR
jgi:UDP-N-acetyl-D-glucosamine dehydrogenase